MKTKTRRIVSLVMLVAFSISEILPLDYLARAGSYSSAVLPESPQIEIPEKIGHIDEFARPEKQGPVLFHVQTAHGNYEAQKNISALLDHLTRHQNTNLIFLEGGKGRLHPELFRFFPGDHNLNLKIADSLMQKAELTGGEFFLVRGSQKKAGLKDKIQGYGIENPKIYRKNRKTFRALLKNREKVKEFAGELHRNLIVPALGYLNPSLRRLVRMRHAYETKNLEFQAWMALLRDSAKRRLETDLDDPSHQREWPMLIRLTRLEKIEKRLDASKLGVEKSEFLRAIKRLGVRQPVREELNALIETNVRAKKSDRKLPYPGILDLMSRLLTALPENFSFSPYPNLKYYIQSVILENELKSGPLFDEIRRLESKIEDALARTPEEQRLLRLLREAGRLEKLLNAELSREEYDEMTPDLEHLRPSRWLAGVHADNQTRLKAQPSFKNAEAYDRLFDAACSFYADALTRESFMADHIISLMRQSDQDRAVLVTGGFHSEGIKKLFEKKGFSYFLITPKITAVATDKSYEQAMLNETISLKSSGIENIIKIDRWQDIADLAGSTNYARRYVGGLIEREISRLKLSSEQLKAMDRQLLRRQYGVTAAMKSLPGVNLPPRHELRMPEDESKKIDKSKMFSEEAYTDHWFVEAFWDLDLEQPEDLAILRSLHEALIWVPWNIRQPEDTLTGSGRNLERFIGHVFALEKDSEIFHAMKLLFDYRDHESGHFLRYPRVVRFFRNLTDIFEYKPYGLAMNSLLRKRITFTLEESLKKIAKRHKTARQEAVDGFRWVAKLGFSDLARERLLTLGKNEEIRPAQMLTIKRALDAIRAVEENAGRRPRSEVRTLTQVRSLRARNKGKRIYAVRRSLQGRDADEVAKALMEKGSVILLSSSGTPFTFSYREQDAYETWVERQWYGKTKKLYSPRFRITVKDNLKHVGHIDVKLENGGRKAVSDFGFDPVPERPESESEPLVNSYYASIEVDDGYRERYKGIGQSLASLAMEIARLSGALEFVFGEVKDESREFFRKLSLQSVLKEEIYAEETSTSGGFPVKRTRFRANLAGQNLFPPLRIEDQRPEAAPPDTDGLGDAMQEELDFLHQDSPDSRSEIRNFQDPHLRTFMGLASDIVDALGEEHPAVKELSYLVYMAGNLDSPEEDVIDAIARSSFAEERRRLERVTGKEGVFPELSGKVRDLFSLFEEFHAGRSEIRSQESLLELYHNQLHERLPQIQEYPEPDRVAKILRGFRKEKNGKYVTRKFPDGAYVSLVRIEDPDIVRASKEEFRKFKNAVAQFFPKEEHKKIISWEVSPSNAHIMGVVFQEPNALLDQKAPRLSEKDQDNLKTLLETTANGTEPVPLMFVGYGVGSDGGFVRLYADPTGKFLDLRTQLSAAANQITDGRISSRPKYLISMTVGRILSLPYHADSAISRGQKIGVLNVVNHWAEKYEEQWKTNLSRRQILEVSGIRWVHEDQWLTSKNHKGEEEIYYPFQKPRSEIRAYEAWGVDSKKKITGADDAGDAFLKNDHRLMLPQAASQSPSGRLKPRTFNGLLWAEKESMPGQTGKKLQLPHQFSWAPENFRRTLRQIRLQSRTLPHPLKLLQEIRGDVRLMGQTWQSLFDHHGKNESNTSIINNQYNYLESETTVNWNFHGNKRFKFRSETRDGEEIKRDIAQTLNGLPEELNYLHARINRELLQRYLGAGQWVPQSLSWLRTLIELSDAWLAASRYFGGNEQNTLRDTGIVLNMLAHHMIELFQAEDWQMQPSEIAVAKFQPLTDMISLHGHLAGVLRIMEPFVHPSFADDMRRRARHIRDTQATLWRSYEASNMHEIPSQYNSALTAGIEDALYPVWPILSWAQARAIASSKADAGDWRGEAARKNATRILEYLKTQPWNADTEEDLKARFLQLSGDFLFAELEKSKKTSNLRILDTLQIERDSIGEAGSDKSSYGPWVETARLLLSIQGEYAFLDEIISRDSVPGTLMDQMGRWLAQYSSHYALNRNERTDLEMMYLILNFVRRISPARERRSADAAPVLGFNPYAYSARRELRNTAESPGAADGSMRAWRAEVRQNEAGEILKQINIENEGERVQALQRAAEFLKTIPAGTGEGSIGELKRRAGAIAWDKSSVEVEKPSGEFLSQWEQVLGHYRAVIEDLKREIQLVKDLAGRGEKDTLRFTRINATASGGGVAEINRNIIPLARSLGMDADWLVPFQLKEVVNQKPLPQAIREHFGLGESATRLDAFFKITKWIHHGLQNNPKKPPKVFAANLVDEIWGLYRDVVTTLGVLIQGNLKDEDIIIVDDPQVAPLIPLIKAVNPHGVVISRIHIDVSNPLPEFWDKIKKDIDQADLVLVHTPKFVNDYLGLRAPVEAVTPSIHPGDRKNSPKPEAFVEATLKAIDPEIMRDFDGRRRPIVFVVARPDIDKGLEDGLDIFVESYKRLAAKGAPAWQKPVFLMALGRADDDPETPRIKQELEKKRASLLQSEDSNVREAARSIYFVEPGDPDGKFSEEQLSVLRKIYSADTVEEWSRSTAARNDLITGAIQQAASVTDVAVKLLPSIREGFGLVIAEAMLKRAVPVARNVGGVHMQVGDQTNGFLFDKNDEAVERMIELIEHSVRAKAMAERGRERVLAEFTTAHNLLKILEKASQILLDRRIERESRDSKRNELRREEKYTKAAAESGINEYGAYDGAAGSSQSGAEQIQSTQSLPWRLKPFQTFYSTFLGSLLLGQAHNPKMKNAIKRIYEAIRIFKLKLIKNWLASDAPSVRLNEFMNVRAIKSLLDWLNNAIKSPSPGIIYRNILMINMQDINDVFITPFEKGNNPLLQGAAGLSSPARLTSDSLLSSNKPAGEQARPEIRHVNYSTVELLTTLDEGVQGARDRIAVKRIRRRALDGQLSNQKVKNYLQNRGLSAPDSINDYFDELADSDVSILLQEFSQAEIGQIQQDVLAAVNLQMTEARKTLGYALRRLNDHRLGDIAAAVRHYYPKVLPYLVKGQDESPVHHVTHVLNFMSQILISEWKAKRIRRQDILAGLLAVLFHDSGIGYQTIRKIPESEFKDVIDPEVRGRLIKKAIESRLQHMEKGEEIVRLVLAQDRSLPMTDSVIERAAKIVRLHDNSKIPLLQVMLDPEKPFDESALIQTPLNRTGVSNPDNLDWLLQLHWEADALWMVSKAGIETDQKRAKDNDKTPMTGLAQLEYNRGLHRQIVQEVYRRARTLDFDKYGFRDGYLYRSKKGYEIFKRLANELHKTAVSKEHMEIAAGEAPSAPSGVPQALTAEETEKANRLVNHLAVRADRAQIPSEHVLLVLGNDRPEYSGMVVRIAQSLNSPQIVIVGNGVLGKGEALEPEWQRIRKEIIGLDASLASRIVVADDVGEADTSMNTGENVTIAVKIFQKKGLGTEHIVLTQMPTGQRVSYRIFQKQWQQNTDKMGFAARPPTFYPFAPELPFTLTPNEELDPLSLAYLKHAQGQIRRLRTWPETIFSGQQTSPIDRYPEDLPEDVLAADASVAPILDRIDRASQDQTGSGPSQRAERRGPEQSGTQPEGRKPDAEPLVRSKVLNLNAAAATLGAFSLAFIVGYSALRQSHENKFPFFRETKAGLKIPVERDEKKADEAGNEDNLNPFIARNIERPTVRDKSQPTVAARGVLHVLRDAPSVLNLNEKIRRSGHLAFFKIETQPKHGTLTAHSGGVLTGMFVYEPQAGYTGGDSFTFSVEELVRIGNQIERLRHPEKTVMIHIPEAAEHFQHEYEYTEGESEKRLKVYLNVNGRKTVLGDVKVPDYLRLKGAAAGTLDLADPAAASGIGFQDGWAFLRKGKTPDKDQWIFSAVFNASPNDLEDEVRSYAPYRFIFVRDPDYAKPIAIDANYLISSNDPALKSRLDARAAWGGNDENLKFILISRDGKEIPKEEIPQGLEFNPDGSFTYTPPAFDDYKNEATMLSWIYFKVRDKITGKESDPASVQITVRYPAKGQPDDTGQRHELRKDQENLLSSDADNLADSEVLKLLNLIQRLEGINRWGAQAERYQDLLKEAAGRSLHLSLAHARRFVSLYQEHIRSETRSSKQKEGGLSLNMVQSVIWLAKKKGLSLEAQDILKLKEASSQMEKLLYQAYVTVAVKKQYEAVYPDWEFAVRKVLGRTDSPSQAGAMPEQARAPKVQETVKEQSKSVTQPAKRRRGSVNWNKALVREVIQRAAKHPEIGPEGLRTNKVLSAQQRSIVEKESGYQIGAKLYQASRMVVTKKIDGAKDWDWRQAVLEAGFPEIALKLGRAVAGGKEWDEKRVEEVIEKVAEKDPKLLAVVVITHSRYKERRVQVLGEDLARQLSGAYEAVRDKRVFAGLKWLEVVEAKTGLKRENIAKSRARPKAPSSEAMDPESYSRLTGDRPDVRSEIRADSKGATVKAKKLSRRNFVRAAAIALAAGGGFFGFKVIERWTRPPEQVASERAAKFIKRMVQGRRSAMNHADMLQALFPGRSGEQLEYSHIASDASRVYQDGEAIELTLSILEGTVNYWFYAQQRKVLPDEDIDYFRQFHDQLPYFSLLELIYTRVQLNLGWDRDPSEDPLFKDFESPDHFLEFLINPDRVTSDFVEKIRLDVIRLLEEQGLDHDAIEDLKTRLGIKAKLSRSEMRTHDRPVTRRAVLNSAMGALLSGGLAAFAGSGSNVSAQNVPMFREPLSPAKAAAAFMTEVDLPKLESLLDRLEKKKIEPKDAGRELEWIKKTIAGTLHDMERRGTPVELKDIEKILDRMIKIYQNHGSQLIPEKELPTIRLMKEWDEFRWKETIPALDKTLAELKKEGGDRKKAEKAIIEVYQKVVRQMQQLESVHPALTLSIGARAVDLMHGMPELERQLLAYYHIAFLEAMFGREIAELSAQLERGDVKHDEILAQTQKFDEKLRSLTDQIPADALDLHEDAFDTWIQKNRFISRLKQIVPLRSKEAIAKEVRGDVENLLQTAPDILKIREGLEKNKHFHVITHLSSTLGRQHAWYLGRVADNPQSRKAKSLALQITAKHRTIIWMIRRAAPTLTSKIMFHDPDFLQESNLLFIDEVLKEETRVSLNEFLPSFTRLFDRQNPDLRNLPSGSKQDLIQTIFQNPYEKKQFSVKGEWAEGAVKVDKVIILDDFYQRYFGRRADRLLKELTSKPIEPLNGDDWVHYRDQFRLLREQRFALNSFLSQSFQPVFEHVDRREKAPYPAIVLDVNSETARQTSGLMFDIRLELWIRDPLVSKEERARRHELYEQHKKLEKEEPSGIRDQKDTDGPQRNELRMQSHDETAGLLKEFKKTVGEGSSSRAEERKAESAKEQVFAILNEADRPFRPKRLDLLDVYNAENQSRFNAVEFIQRHLEEAVSEFARQASIFVKAPFEPFRAHDVVIQLKGSTTYIRKASGRPYWPLIRQVNGAYEMDVTVYFPENWDQYFKHLFYSHLKDVRQFMENYFSNLLGPWKEKIELEISVLSLKDLENASEKSLWPYHPMNWYFGNGRAVSRLLQKARSSMEEQQEAILKKYIELYGEAQNYLRAPEAASVVKGLKRLLLLAHLRGNRAEIKKLFLMLNSLGKKETLDTILLTVLRDSLAAARPLFQQTDIEGLVRAYRGESKPAAAVLARYEKRNLYDLRENMRFHAESGLIYRQQPIRRAMETMDVSKFMIEAEKALELHFTPFPSWIANRLYSKPQVEVNIAEGRVTVFIPFTKKTEERDLAAMIPEIMRALDRKIAAMRPSMEKIEFYLTARSRQAERIQREYQELKNFHESGLRKDLLQPISQKLGAVHDRPADFHGIQVEMVAGAHGALQSAEIVLELSPAILANPGEWAIFLEGAESVETMRKKVGELSMAAFPEYNITRKLAAMHDIPVMDPLPDTVDGEIVSRVARLLNLSPEDVLAAIYFKELMGMFSRQNAGEPVDIAERFRLFLLARQGSHEHPADLLQDKMAELSTGEEIRAFAAQVEFVYRTARHERNIVTRERLRKWFAENPSRKNLLAVIGYHHAPIFGLPPKMPLQESTVTSKEVVFVMSMLLGAGLRREKTVRFKIPKPPVKKSPVEGEGVMTPVEAAGVPPEIEAHRREMASGRLAEKLERLFDALDNGFQNMLEGYQDINLLELKKAALDLHPGFKIALTDKDLKQRDILTLKDMLNELNLQIFLPNGLLTIANAASGRLSRFIIRESAWRAVPYLGRTIWMNEGSWHAGDVRPTTLAMAYRNFIVSDPGYISQAAIREYERMRVTPVPLDSTIHIQQRLHDLIHQYGITPEQYIEIKKEYAAMEELSHAKDTIFAELAYGEDLTHDRGRDIKTVEAILKSYSDLRLGIWPEKLVWSVDLELSTVTILEMAGQTEAVGRLMDKYFELRQPVTAYLIFLMHLLRKAIELEVLDKMQPERQSLKPYVESAVRFTDSLLVTGPYLQEHKGRWENLMKAFRSGENPERLMPEINAVIDEQNQKFNSWKAILDFLEAEVSIEAAAGRARQVLREIYQANFYDEDERTRYLEGKAESGTGDPRSELRPEVWESVKQLTRFLDGIIPLAWHGTAYFVGVYSELFKERLNLKSRPMLPVTEEKIAAVREQFPALDKDILKRLASAEDDSFGVAAIEIPAGLSPESLHKVLKDFKTVFKNHVNKPLALAYSGAFPADLKDEIHSEFDERIFIFDGDNGAENVLAKIYSGNLSRLSEDNTKWAKRLLSRVSDLAGEPLTVMQLKKSSVAAVRSELRPEEALFDGGLFGISKQFIERKNHLSAEVYLAAQILFLLPLASLSNSELLRQQPDEFEVLGSEDALRLYFRSDFTARIQTLVRAVRHILTAA